MTKTETDYLIIGTGIAGTTAAQTIREKDLEASVILVGSENERLYSRVLLPYFLDGLIGEDQVYLLKDHYYSDHHLGLISGKTVTKINFLQKTAYLDDKTEIVFKKLLIACGGQPNKLTIPGNDLEGVHYFKTLADTTRLKLALKEAQKTVIIGGGFIAIDLAGDFRKRGKETTLIVMEPYFFSRFIDLEGGKLINEIFLQNGVKVFTADQATKILGTPKVTGVVTKSGREIRADLVGVGIGITPELAFLEGSGLNADRYIQTNEFLETTVKDVWAAGDCTRFYDLVTDRHHSLGNWANAADQGRVAGLNMVGDRVFLQAVSSYSTALFDSTLAIIGDTGSQNATSVVKRGSLQEKAYGNLFFKGDFLVGATLIGLVSDRGPIGNLIKNKVEITDKEKLENLNYDLRELLPAP